MTTAREQYAEASSKVRRFKFRLGRWMIRIVDLEAELEAIAMRPEVVEDQAIAEAESVLTDLDVTRRTVDWIKNDLERERREAAGSGMEDA
jgi:hypothetical protein